MAETSDATARDGRERERERRIIASSTRGTGMKIPFAVRYIKLVVECFESYHSHFDELGPQNRSSGKRVRRRRLINNRPRRIITEDHGHLHDVSVFFLL